MKPDSIEHSGASYELHFERRPMFWLCRVVQAGAQLFAVYHPAADQGVRYPLLTVRDCLRRAAVARMAWWYAAS